MKLQLWFQVSLTGFINFCDFILFLRFVEAMHINEAMKSSKLCLESALKSRDKFSVRSAIISGYNKTLPSVTQQLALYCAQEKAVTQKWREGKFFILYVCNNCCFPLLFIYLKFSCNLYLSSADLSLEHFIEYVMRRTYQAYISVPGYKKF